MPSRRFAASPHRVDELTGLSTQRDKVNFASPALAECGFDLEYTLDFKGRRHLDPARSVEKYTFGLQADESSSYPGFPLPGLATVNTLRDYLHEHLQPHQVVDEYGDECDLSGLSNEHLAVLQAKMWYKVYSGRCPTKTRIGRPSRVQALVAGHVSKISQLLEEKHIFVVSNASLDICNYLNDLQVTPRNTCHSQTVRIEPLVHWGTVTPATTSQSILSFCRNGELMKQPEYKHLVRRLVDTEAPAYCVDCLQYLWSKRAEARDTMRQLQGTILRPQSHALEGMAPPQTRLKLKSPEFISVDASTLAVGGTSSSVAYRSKPAEAGLHGGLGKALPQFDGTSDCLEEGRIRGLSSKRQGHEATWISSDSDEPAEAHFGRSIPVPRTASFTLPLRSASDSPKSSEAYSTPFAPPPPSRTLSSTTVKVDYASKKDRRKTAATTDECSSHVIDLTTPPRVKERKFGRELDTNAKVPVVEVRRSPRKQRIEASMTNENSPPAPVCPLKPSKALQKAKGLTKETKKRKTTALLVEQTGKQKKARTTIVKDPKLLQSNVRISSATKVQHLPEPELANRAPSPPKLTVHFAKRPMNPEIPDDIATLAYEAFQNMCPASTAKICWCNKPAGQNTSKKNEPPQISQCISIHCRFRWYHYACLNQSDKLKSRWGNLFCQHCRNKQEFAEQDKKNGWSVEQLTDFKMPLTKEDIKAEMPGLGGHVPMANPYGLGVEIDLGPAYGTESQAKSTLGTLEEFGYAQSHPYMLEEAYINPDAYAGLRAEVAEDEADDEAWWYQTRAPEDDYNDGDEMFDVVTEEEL